MVQGFLQTCLSMFCYCAGMPLEGILEIKCPNKANPTQDQPKLPAANDYYMPQVQLLCEVLDREWAVLYYWSQDLGSHMTLIHRDREYFALLWQAMADFWWQHFVPAKLHLQLHPADETGIKRFEPPKQHPYKGEIQRRSRVMIEHAPKQWFTDAETKRARAAEAATPAALPAP
eukprot:GHRR01030631.1.p1 GENE.GHRR01030631.1~~GHRR01030631.1.p1  ORF type:complete len:174 (+),score=47.52 GHRR01030631.1:694-1215(+)